MLCKEEYYVIICILCKVLVSLSAPVSRLLPSNNHPSYSELFEANIKANHSQRASAETPLQTDYTSPTAAKLPVHEPEPASPLHVQLSFWTFRCPPLDIPSFFLMIHHSQTTLTSISPTGTRFSQSGGGGGGSSNLRTGQSGTGNQRPSTSRPHQQQQQQSSQHHQHQHQQFELSEDQKEEIREAVSSMRSFFHKPQS